MIILKHHYKMAREDWLRKIAAAELSTEWPENLTLERIPATIPNYMPFLHRMGQKWRWDELDRNNNGTLADRLAHPQARLYRLKDGDKVIGHTFVTAIGEGPKEKFFGATPPNVIEIETLGLHPNEEGQGRGTTFFEQMMNELFQEYDVIYWSQNDIHSPTLRNYYENKLGMTHLGTTQAVEFQEFKYG